MATISPIVTVSGPLKLKMDLVHGHEMEVEVGRGKITRMGLITNIIIPSGSTPAPDALIQSLAAQGMPQRADSYPHPAYSKYYCRRHLLRAIAARQAIVEVIYEYYGLRTVRDLSSLQNVQTQLIPGTFQPIIVQWQNPDDPNSKVVKRIGTTDSGTPYRHIEVTATVDHAAGQAVQDAFGGVNNRFWYGLPKAYWKFEEFEGDYIDGINYQFRAVFTTKVVEDWSTYCWMEDERGLPIPVPDLVVMRLMSQPYVYGRVQANGITKVGNFKMYDFANIFGFSEAGSIPV